jgi:hypothetical protein
MCRVACAGLAAVLAAGCRRSPVQGAPGSTRAPKGDAVWLADSAAAGEPGLEDSLQRIGAAALFLPAGEVEFESGRWVLREDPPPPHRLERAPVVLVLRAGPDLSGAFQGAQGPDPAAMARALAASLGRSMGSGGPYGRVIGVLLDFPFSAAGASRYRAFVDALRAVLPPPTFISIVLHALPSSESERKKLQPPLQAADAVVAFAFRDGERVEPAAVDSLRRPWWPAFGTASHGVRTAADGRTVEGVAEKFLDPLSGNPRVDVENDLSENDAAVSAFHMLVRDPVRLEGLSLDRGDRIAFRVPSQTELLYQLGSVLAGKRFALGRVVVFEGASDAERVLPIAAFEDILLGRSLSPSLEVIARPLTRNSVTVEAINRSAHASIISRVSNWVEVDLAPARPADVQLGGFDRYEVYDASGRPVSPGRATRVRFFETLVAPREAVSPARIVVRGALPKGCCPVRLHAIAAAGPEVATEWTSPSPTPTPTPRAKKKR